MMMITIIRWSSVYRNVVPRQMWQTPGSRGAWRRPQILLKRDPLIYHSCHQHFCHHHDQLSPSFIIFLIIGKLDIDYCLVYEFSKKNTGETMFLFNSGWKSKAFLFMSNVVGDKNFRSFLAFKGFRKENQREKLRNSQDNATTDLQGNIRLYSSWWYLCIMLLCVREK